MRKLKTEGFILKKKILLGRDLFITLFTQDYGKINVLAKGIRTITSRRLSHIQTGNLVDIMLNKRGDYLYLQETSLISGFVKVKGNQKSLNYKYFLFYLLNKLLPEDQPEPEIYNYVKRFFVDLSSKDFEVRELEHYLNIILIKLGYIKKRQSLSDLTGIVEELINEKLSLRVI